MGFNKVNPAEVHENFLKLLHAGGLLTAADGDGKINMMTVSSGALGNFFRRDIVYVYVRPGRYTRQLMDSTDLFTLSFYDEEYKPKVAACGRSSGRDTDKVAETGLTPVLAECGAPYFEEAKLVYVCRKIYTENTNPENFLDESMNEWFPNKDYHLVYVGEIVEVLEKED